MTTHTCGAIFGPDGRVEHVAAFGIDEEQTWAVYFGWPDHIGDRVDRLKQLGYRFALVTVTEQTPSVPAPPPPGTRFDEEGVPMETGK